jgi:transcriptional regulator PpsR
VKAFRSPKQSLGDLGAETAAVLIANAADVAVILDGAGVILDIAFQRGDLSAELDGYGKWLGRSFAQTVTLDSQSKVEAMLQEATERAASSPRQLKHLSVRGVELPVLYCIVRLGRGDRCVALGRDQRALAALQQRLVEAQMSMERDYSRLRHVETRYRMLFQMSSEPVFIVDASNLKVIEANPAATELAGEPNRRIIGRPFPDGVEFDAESKQAVRGLLEAAPSARRENEVRARLVNRSGEYLVSASLFRLETSALFLIRLVASAPAAVLPRRSQLKLLELIDKSLDGLVVTDREGRIITASAAFLEMAQLTREDQAQGELIDRWLGRGGVDLDVVMANLRQHGSLPLFATTLRGEYGTTTQIEISAVTLKDRDEPSFGFMIRNLDRRAAVDSEGRHELPRSIAQLTGLIGRVPLKDLVRETTDVIERMCIEAALALTHDNRAMAAEMLGLSRQSLYVKLRRFGLTDLASDTESGSG